MSNRPSDETLREWTRILTPGQAAMARELLEARERIVELERDLHGARAAFATCRNVLRDGESAVLARLALAEEVIEAARVLRDEADLLQAECRRHPSIETRLRGLLAHLDRAMDAAADALDRYDAVREET